MVAANAMDKLRLLCVLSLVCWSTQQPTPLKTCAHEGRPMIETKQGFICGTHCPDGPEEVCGKKVAGSNEYITGWNTRNYKAFCGIPFAQPPVGELRFKRPVQGESWSDYRDGSWMPPSCPQLDMKSFLTGNLTTTGQEDCLFLNVYVPELTGAPPASGLPVMVWIHGGGFYMGNVRDYFPNKLMKRDVILVTIQYRLAILGFLSTDDDVAPGNLALKDQELSLRWVQDNIERFGGDSSKVTIFGESAGAISVHMQMFNPQAKGLFSRAILQSGTALMDLYQNTDHREQAYQVATRLGCSIQKDYNSEELIKCLQQYPALSFVDIAMSFIEWGSGPLAFRPRFGEASLPDLPSRLLRDGEYNKVDIMMGINQDEGGMIAKQLCVQPNAFVDIGTNFSNVGHHAFYMNKNEIDVAKQMYEYYLGAIRIYNEEEDPDSLSEMFSDYLFNMFHDYSIELHARDTLYGKNVYAYELKHKGDDALGAFVAPHIGKDYVNHGDDLLYLFNFDFFNVTSNPENNKLESIMLDLWTNFAYYGNPTPNRYLGFTWRPITIDSMDHLVLKPEPYMEADTRCERRKFFTTLNISANRNLFPDDIGAGPKWKPWKHQNVKTCW